MGGRRLDGPLGEGRQVRGDRGGGERVRGRRDEGCLGLDRRGSCVDGLRDVLLEPLGGAGHLHEVRRRLKSVLAHAHVFVMVWCKTPFYPIPAWSPHSSVRVATSVGTCF